MEILRFTLDKLPEKEDKLSLTLGYFDGFHLGHQALAFKAFEASEGLNAILLFDLPVSSFPNRNSTACLSSLEQKLIQASRNRFERAYVLEADSSFFDKTSEDFEKLLSCLGATSLFVGEDFTYGKNARGNAESLVSSGFKVEVVPLLEKEGKKVSSSSIKELIQNGLLEEANERLGYPYEIKGEVVHGRGLGRSLGFPTANLKLEMDYVLPHDGAYLGFAYVRGLPRKAMISIGTNPTLGEDNARSIEAHILDFDEDLYGRNLTLAFLKQIRPVIRFSSLEELKAQLSLDKHLIETLQV